MSRTAARRAAQWVMLLFLAGWSSWAACEAMSRESALRNLSAAKPALRLAAVLRLGDVGRMQDSARLAALLSDDDDEVRAATEGSMWRVWARSGDRRVDTLYKQGLGQMNAANAEAGVATFSEVIRLKPDFAEGWNKRATLYYFLGRYQESIADCEEVIKRWRRRGALSYDGRKLHSRAAA